MARSNAFAFKNSGLGSFLYAEVGTELNGSVLTIQSVLARLGQDPWAEAARWVSLPKATIIDRLAACIAQMPLSPQALFDSRKTAARLVKLLPAHTNSSGAETERLVPGLPSMPAWMPMALILGALACGLAINLLNTPASGSASGKIATQDPLASIDPATQPTVALPPGQ